MANQLRLAGKLAFLKAELKTAESKLVESFQKYESSEVPFECRYQMRNIAEDLADLYEQLDNSDEAQSWRTKFEPTPPDHE